jgi:hypothetical protein
MDWVAIEKNGETPLHIFVDIADNSFKFVFQERKGLSEKNEVVF